LNHTRLW